MTQSTWDFVMNRCPGMKVLIENKINEEVAKKQTEIDALKEENTTLKDENATQGTIIADLDFRLLMGGL